MKEDYAVILAILATHSPLPFAAWSPEGRVLAVNEAFCGLTGYTRGELLALPQLAALVPHEERARLAAMLGEQPTRRRSVRLETDCVRGDGRRVPVEVWVDSLRDADGLLQCYYALVNDVSAQLSISARRRSEDSTREALGMLEDVSGAMADVALMILDETGDVLRFFGETAMLGASPEGRNVRAVLPPSAAQNIMDMVAAALAGGCPQTTEFCALTGGATRMMVVSVTPMVRRYRGRRIVSLHARDVTAEKAVAGRLTLMAQIYGRSAFFNGLLVDVHADEDVAAALEDYGVDTCAGHCCLVLQLERDEPAEQDWPVAARAASNEEIIAWLTEKEPGWAWKSNGDIVMLVPTGAGLRTKENRLRFARRLVRDVEGRFAFVRVKAGMADADEGTLDMRRLYRQAMDALLVGGSEAVSSVVHYADIGLYQVAFQMLKDKNCLALVQKTVGGLAAYDREHGNNLLTTLARILEERNLKAAAQKLYIHHNTALWRKKRIEKILGMSLDSFETRALVSLYLKVWRLAGLN